MRGRSSPAEAFKDVGVARPRLGREFADSVLVAAARRGITDGAHRGLLLTDPLGLGEQCQCLLILVR